MTFDDFWHSQPFGWAACDAMTLARHVWAARQAEIDMLSKWHPIDTAPRDKRVMVWSGQEMYCAHWAQNPTTGDEAWIVAEWGEDGDQALVKPTHWRPLPLPPNIKHKGPPVGGPA